MAAPTGTVTFLFTDIEGSTRLWESAPERMRSALGIHDAIVRGAIEGNGGHVFSTGGDGFGAAFARPERALAAAAQAQEAITSQAWPEDAVIRVRMALHTGTAEERGGDYFGGAVNRAARLMALGHGGQTLCSSVTAGMLDGADLVDLGEHRLRDLSAPERVYQLGRASFPPLQSVDAYPGNLPPQVSSFIGREAELARTQKALNEARVVTLTGVGGVGKTRLALRAAAEALPSFRDGAWLVELAPVRDSDGVAAAVATVFQVTAHAGLTLEASLWEFLKAKHLLLVLDNAEHLLDVVAAFVETISHRCAGVVVLTTSREGLALEGERVLPVPSLTSPAPSADIEAAAAADSVRLFVDRASAVDPDFVLTAANAGPVIEICRRLDGVPLAIELAAARVGAMTPAELAQGLDRRFATLAGGRRRAVDRHKTLRAAIDWSYDLLTHTEQRLLARLAVFAGGWTRAAAEAVCGGDPLSPGEVFEALAGLVAKSLVIAQRDSNETRYRLLETIREYGEDRLAELVETEPLRRAHADYYREWAARRNEQLFGPQQLLAARSLAADYDNLLAAIRHAVDTGDVDLAMGLVCSMPPPGLQVGHRLVVPVDAALGLPGASGHERYPFALAIASSEAAFRGDLERAEEASEAALTAFARSGPQRDPRVEWIATNAKGAIALATGEWSEAAKLMIHSADLVRTSDASPSRLPTMSYILAGAAFACTLAENPQQAEPLAVEGLACARQLGAPSHIAMNLLALAGAVAERDQPRARALLDESLTLHARLDFESPHTSVEATLIAARMGDWPLVLRMSLNALRQLAWGGEWPYVGGILNVVARALVASDPTSAAILQGASRQFVPAAPRARRADSTTPPQQRGSAASFLTETRRQTSAVLRSVLEDGKLRQLRAQGETMDREHVVPYALTAIKNHLART